MITLKQLKEYLNALPEEYEQVNVTIQINGICYPLEQQDFSIKENFEKVNFVYKENIDEPDYVAEPILVIQA